MYSEEIGLELVEMYFLSIALNLAILSLIFFLDFLWIINDRKSWFWKIQKCLNDNFDLVAGRLLDPRLGGGLRASSGPRVKRLTRHWEKVVKISLWLANFSLLGNWLGNPLSCPNEELHVGRSAHPNCRTQSLHDKMGPTSKFNSKIYLNCSTRLGMQSAPEWWKNSVGN